MKFAIFLPLIVLMVASVKKGQADRMATIQQYKFFDPPAKNTDMEFYLSTMEKLDKLISEADQMRNMQREFMRTAFGLTMETTTTNESASSTPKPASRMMVHHHHLGAPRKAAEGWVRQPLSIEKLEKILNIPKDDNLSQ